MKKRRSIRPESGTASVPPSVPPSREEVSSPSEGAVPISLPRTPLPNLASDDPLASALQAAVAKPDDDDAWAKLEELAGAAQRPEVASDAYLHVLEEPIAPELASRLGQSAVRLHDEWFSEPDHLIAILSRVMRRDPSAAWAFERLVMVLTVAARWEELLAAYDHALSTIDDRTRRAQLLDEAAHVAKDFAGQADRAIEYLKALLPLRPSDAQLATSLERLLERQGRHRDLVDLWNARVSVLSRDGRLATRARIAAAWLDKLGRPDEALLVCETLIAEDPHDTAGSRILERIATLETAEPAVRRRSLEILKTRYAAAKKTGDVVRILEIALAQALPADRASIHREIVDRLVELSRDDAAIEHAAAVVRLEPGEEGARARLRELSEKVGKHDKRAEALAHAVEATEGRARVSLLIETAEVRADLLSDDAGAADFFARALAAQDATDSERLAVARRLEVLLDRLGRPRERLDVLDRLAQLETDETARREVLARGAGVASSLGDVERALSSWQKRLSEDAADPEALDAVVEILQRASRHGDLVAALRRRADATSDDEKKRADLGRIATIEERELGNVAAAVDAWHAIDAAFGPSHESVDALGRLLAAESRWEELATHLSSAAERESDLKRKAELLFRLGDVQRERLSALDRAGATYRDALAAEPSHRGARAGLRAILERATDRTVLADAANTLAAAYRVTDDWASLLEIVEHRVAVADAANAKGAVLIDAAKLYEERAKDPAAALAAVARAFPLMPGDASLELEVVRLAEITGQWNVAVDALGAAIAACTAVKGAGADPLRAATLRVQQGALLEARLADPSRALEAYLPVLAVFPESSEATEAVVRVAGKVGRWDDAAGAFVEYSRAQSRVDGNVVETFEHAADEQDSWEAATSAMELAIGRAEGLASSIGRDLETMLALWFRDRREDAPRAERALTRAIAHDPSDAEAFRLLAVLQRRHPDAALFDTLLGLASLTGDDLGVLYEAAQVALDVVVDRSKSTQVLERLLAAARPRWSDRNTMPTLPPTSGPAATAAESNALTAENFARWAIDRLVELHTEGEQPDAAIDVLVRGAALPFDEEHARAFRHRAAEIATSSLPGSARAIELYREILTGAPDDDRAIAALARLYEGEQMFTELAALRRHELSYARNTDARLPLRLDLARVLGLAGQVDAQLDALRENLEERPGHDETIDRAAEVLDAAGRQSELAHLLSEQALLLEAASDGPRAAVLWARVAKLAEESLSDVPRALASWGRVVALQPTAEAFDALARLHAARRESAVAIAWLEKRLAATPAGERAQTVVRLAEEHLRSGDRARALEVLEAGLEAEPTDRPLREKLVALHRETSDWGLVAQLLRDGAVHEQEPVKRVAWLREAANLFVKELNDPEGAVPLFAEAAQIGESRPLRVELADALRRANRNDEARQILDELVEWYGRRRPPERAQVHVQLAHLARARGDSAEALAQLELASSMDMGSAQILRDLGGLARESGDYARAERAYRALLLLVRRPGAQLDTAIGPSEVLFELHRIAAALGQEDRARENLESAFEASSSSEAEGRRFVQLLRESGNEAFLVRALEARVAAAQDAAMAAVTLIELADVLDGMGRVEDALQARLDALAHQPESLPLHAAVRDVARRAGKLERYQERLRELADRARAGGEAGSAAAFLLRLGEVYEQDAGDLARAAAAYAEAESTGEQAVSALEAIARLARARTDREGELTALRKLVQIDDQDAQKRTDALYRLADLLLANADGRDEGVDMLAWAVDREPQLERALTMLRAVPGKDEKIANLQERVARAGTDSAVLLEALERVAATDSVSFDVLREASELAAKSEEPGRAEGLLVRTIEVARGRDALDEVLWALTALAERRREAGDREKAVELLREAASRAQGAEAFDLDLQAASLAEPKVAAEIYERLLQPDPGERRVWEPLLEVYRKLGERTKLEGLIANTIDNVFDAGERNVLRLERVRLMLDVPGREADAETALREILDDEPDQLGAVQLLMDLLEKRGRKEELGELVQRQLDAARDRDDAEAIALLSLRLGGLQESFDRARALETYRTASDRVPDNRALLDALVKLYKPTDDAESRATVLERLLAIEKGDAAAALAIEIANLRHTMGDEPGAVRALEAGFRESPTNEKVRSRLEKALLAAGEFARLAAVYVADAETKRDKRVAVARYREAAKLHQEKLADPGAAAVVLRRARELLPDDLTLLTELSYARAAAGENKEALADIEAALATHETGAARVTLLRVRAQLRLGSGDLAGAVEDLESAFAAGGAAIGPELVDALERRRADSARRKDLATERLVTRRLVEVLSATGDPTRGHDVLIEWLQRDPQDKDALRTLAAIDHARGDFSGVVDALMRVVALETGPEQAQAALDLADAADHCDRQHDARTALEVAVRGSPEDPRLRARLRMVYEATEAFAELAQLTLLDAEHAADDTTRFELLVSVGDLYLRSVGEEANAIDPLERALQLKPFHHETTLLLADAYTVSGDIDRAVALLTPAIERHKGKRSKEVAALQHRMARAANAGGGRDVELQWLTRALECDMQNGQVAAELAEVAIELRQFDVALKALKAVTLLRTPGPMSRALATLRQGQIAYQQGDSKRAVILAKQALRDEPGMPEAEEFLRELGA